MAKRVKDFAFAVPLSVPRYSSGFGGQYPTNLIAPSRNGPFHFHQSFFPSLAVSQVNWIVDFLLGASVGRTQIHL
jgi:hypothetical protein